MKNSARLLSFCAIFIAAFLVLPEQSAAQIIPGDYRLVGALGRPSGAGFFGKVKIAGAGAVRVRLNNGYTLHGRVDENGDFTVNSVRRKRQRLTASGSVKMQNGTYAVGDVNVPGQGKGFMMLGPL